MLILLFERVGAHLKIMFIQNTNWTSSFRTPVVASLAILVYQKIEFNGFSKDLPSVNI